MKRLVCALALLIVGCGGPQGPPLSATDVVAWLPLVPAAPAALYFDLHNGSDRSLTLDSIDCDQFARVEWHETVTRDGMSTMQPLANLTLPAGQSMPFRPGGRHVMLLEPKTPLFAGMALTVRIHYAGGGVLQIATTLQRRLPGNEMLTP